MIKDVFHYLDSSNTQAISYSDFASLSEENLQKTDIIDYALSILLKPQTNKQSCNPETHSPTPFSPPTVAIAALPKKKPLEDYLMELKKMKDEARESTEGAISGGNGGAVATASGLGRKNV